MSIKLELQKTFKASQKKIFEAFTEPEVLKQWFVPDSKMTVTRAEFEKKVGGAYILEIQNLKGESFVVSGLVQVFQPYEKLSYTWKWDSPDSVETLVTLNFVEKGSETEVFLLHEKFQSEDSKAHHKMGWDGCLGSLENIYK